MTTTRFTLLAAAALAVVLTACSSPAAVDLTSTTATPTPSSSVASETSPSGPPVATTPDVTASATSESPGTEASAPSPVDGFGLSGQDLLNAQAAWDAYGGYQAFYKQAQADPGADWSGQLASLTADPLIVNAQSSLTTQARLGQTVDNQLRVELMAVQVFPTYVLFSGCFDNSATTARDKDGNDVKAPNAPGSYYRTPGEVEVDSVNGAWVIVDIVFPDRNSSC